MASRDFGTDLVFLPTRWPSRQTLERAAHTPREAWLTAERVQAAYAVSGFRAVRGEFYFPAPDTGTETRLVCGATAILAAKHGLTYRPAHHIFWPLLDILRPHIVPGLDAWHIIPWALALGVRAAYLKGFFDGFDQRAADAYIFDQDDAADYCLGYVHGADAYRVAPNGLTETSQEAARVPVEMAVA